MVFVNAQEQDNENLSLHHLHLGIYEELRKSGYVRVKVNGIVYPIEEFPSLEKNKKHDISAEIEDRFEPEFSATDNETDEDFNQEAEEELLDIPTFLRRQAN